MRRGFIRTLWGVKDRPGRMYQRRGKIDNDIRLIKHNPIPYEFKVYVFGEENYNECLGMGFNCELINKDPIVWSMEKQQFRHKLEAFRAASSDFDEFIFLDWDTIPFKEIPENFWEKMYEKEEIQANLIQYRRRKTSWRKKDARKISSASFVYIRNNAIPEKLIDKWKEMGKPWSEEIVMSKYIDDNFGGWKGVDNYWEKHDPYWYNAPQVYWYFPREKIMNEKNIVFRHVNERQVRGIFKEIELKGSENVGWERYGF